jgi:hypothetical protein
MRAMNPHVPKIGFCKVEDAFDNDSILTMLGVKWGDFLYTAEQIQAHVTQLHNLIAELAQNSTYQTEYDGRMYTICHGCGAQDDEPHRTPDCVYARAQTISKGKV